MPLCEIVLRVAHQEDELRLIEVDGGGDGTVIRIDDRDWFVMMTMPAQGEEALQRLVCVRVDGLR